MRKKTSRSYFDNKNTLPLGLLALITIGIFIYSISISRPKEINTGNAVLQGDCDNSNTVDILDFQFLSNSFGKSAGQSGYNSGCDFDTSSSITILDFQILSNNFGRTGTTNTPTQRPTVTTAHTPTRTPTSPPPGGNIYWRGDAESGDLSQWCTTFREAPDRIQVVTSPVKQGRYAYRINVQANDNPSGERATLSQICRPTERPGDDKYYGMSVMLPSGFPDYSAWSQVMQFKANDTGSPPVQITYTGGQWQLTHRPNVSSGNIVKWRTPARKGVWESFIFHIKWSSNPQTGLIELWYNGNRVASFNTSTIHVMNGVTYPNFVAIGHYRDASISDNVILYHDGFVSGSTFASVAQ